MTKISKSLADLGQDLTYDAVVVGSGYGGAVAALRLAEAGKKVCLLERGAEVLPGSYPRTLGEAAAQLRLVTAQDGLILPAAPPGGAAQPLPNGMMELRLGPDMSVILGNGLGGGSLINANVAARPDDRVLADASWPAVYHDPAAMDAYFAKASTMLGATPLPAAITPPKLAALQVSAKAIGQPMIRPPLAVNFTEGQVSTGGIAQPACTHCGDCCAGCNYGAKNTLLMNYLPAAAKKGAVIVTQAQVQTITSISGSTGWRIAVQDMSQPPGAPAISLKAGAVVLAAGALGSTEILARSAAAGLALSSKCLGQRFSGNGDILGFGLDANVFHWLPQPGDKPPPPTAAELPELYSIGAGANPAKGVPGQGNPFAPGPTITGMVQVKMGPSDPISKALVIEDGVAPGALALVYPAVFMLDSALSANMLEFPDTERRLKDIQDLGSQIVGGTLSASLAYQAPMTRMQSYLVMSHDTSDGALAFDADTGMVSVQWPGVGQSRPYPTDNAWLSAMAQAIWANYLPNPLWQKDMGGQLVSVHPLGGAVMAETAAQGVVDPDCHLYTGTGDATYPTFLVCDGSVLPSSLGINPFLTITAVAERAMDRFLQAQTKAPAAAPPKAAPKAAPLVAVAAPAPTPTPAPEPPDETLSKLMLALDGIHGFLELGMKFDKDRDHLVLESLLAAAAGDLLPTKDVPAAISAITAAVKNMSAQDFITACTELDNDILALIATITDPPTNDARWAALEDKLFDLLGPVDPTLAFSETMRGYAGTATPVKAQILSSGYEIAAELGKAKNFAVTAKFSVIDDNSQNLKKMPHGFDQGLKAELTGTITMGGVTQTISDGTFTLFKPDDGQVETWTMVYTGTLGSDYSFTGTKYLARPDQTGQSWFQDLTTLYVDFTSLKSQEKTLQGILTLGLQDMAPQVAGTTARFSADDATDAFLSLMQALGSNQLAQAVASRAVLNRLALALVGVASQSSLEMPRTMASRLAQHYEASVAAFFGRLVFRTNGGLLSYMYDFPAQDALTAPSAVPVKATGWQITTKKGEETQSWTAQQVLLTPQGTPAPDADQAAIVLYRYKGGTDGQMKGPVVLSPGYGTTVLSFACLTNNTGEATDNVVIQLLKAGYDVWLYDNRSRPGANLPAFSLDDIAKTDWPVAVNYVLQATKAKDVQILGHCVGGMSAQMALLAGGLVGKVRNLVSSQLTVQPVTNWFNQAKGDINLATALAASRLGPIAQRLADAGLPIPTKLIEALKDTNQINAVTPAGGAQSDADQILNLAAWYVPFGGDHACQSPTCHRIFAIFGPSYLHANLNQATHDGIRDFFGQVTMSSFEQLGQIVALGRAVDAQGRDTYMGNVANLNLPIHFIAGAKNLEFLPDTSLKTLRWLQKSLPPGAGPFTRKLYHSYGHMDFFIGKDAGTDIFPDLVAELDKYNPPPT